MSILPSEKLLDWFCLCWGLTSQSTIFQLCRDGATASWVINQYFRGVKCLAQGHNTAAVGIEPPTSRSGVRHSTTEPPRSPSRLGINLICWQLRGVITLHLLHIPCVWAWVKPFYLSQFMWKRLSHRQTAKAQTSLHIPQSCLSLGSSLT